MSNFSTTEYVLGVLCGVTMAIVVGLIIASAHGRGRYWQACAKACAPGKPLTYIDGTCVCANGNVYRWREGYTLRIGEP